MAGLYQPALPQPELAVRLAHHLWAHSMVYTVVMVSISTS
jgi:hypothetical protein